MTEPSDASKPRRRTTPAASRLSGSFALELARPASYVFNAPEIRSTDTPGMAATVE
jgi:hypothetical protein